MPNFEGSPIKSNQSVNEVFKSRAEFIPEVGGQLEKETKTAVNVNGERLSVDYREISIESKENKDGDIVVLLPGFGSGWEGITELGFSLACEGRRVVMPSLPGYGNSDDPSEKYYQTDNFDSEVEVLSQLLDKIGLPPGSRVHLIGHSMGSEIFASFAEKYPDKVSSLVLLNPAGVETDDDVVR
ncbi:MAG: alpha/beta fold hydrolase, partial [Patescibacteria group bacterium]